MMNDEWAPKFIIYHSSLILTVKHLKSIKLHSTESWKWGFLCFWAFGMLAACGQGKQYLKAKNPQTVKQIISTPNAPGAIGPYNQATIYNGILYASGQIAIDPATGELVQGSLEEETHRVLKNVGAILEAAGCTYKDVLKASVFIKDMHQFARINAVYAEYFDPAWAPARETVEVANLPKFVNIEISVIAAVPQK
jgi:2-iminobutanoate/2-iminopropanoate deaminase